MYQCRPYSISETMRTPYTVYPKKYAHGFVVLCFVVVMLSLIMNSHEVFIHIHQGCFAGTGAIVRLPQCQWSRPDGYGKISQCKTTTKHSKAKTVCIFLGIYCSCHIYQYFTYCIEVWGNAYLKSLNILQKRAIRMMDGAKKWTKLYPFHSLKLFQIIYIYILCSIVDVRVPIVFILETLLFMIIKPDSIIYYTCPQYELKHYQRQSH